MEAKEKCRSKKRPQPGFLLLAQLNTAASRPTAPGTLQLPETSGTHVTNSKTASTGWYMETFPPLPAKVLFIRNVSYYSQRLSSRTRKTEHPVAVQINFQGNIHSELLTATLKASSERHWMRGVKPKETPRKHTAYYQLSSVLYSGGLKDFFYLEVCVKDQINVAKRYFSEALWHLPTSHSVIWI